MLTNFNFPTRAFTVLIILLVKFQNSTFSQPLENSTLRQLFIIFRHGDRAPIDLYPNDPNSPADFPDGLGELTNVGKLQHFELGQYLRKRYSSFLSDDPKEVRVNSSNVNRCLDSVEAHLAGLYPPNGRHIWNKQLNWQPIPIHTRFESEDNVLTLDPDCPEYDKELQRVFQTSEVQDYIKKCQPLFEYLTNYTGEKVKKLKDVSYLYDTLEIEKIKGLIVPTWSDSVWDEMKDVEAFNFYIRYSTTLAKRLKGGPLLKDIVEKIELKVQSDKQLKEKVFIYSTHDVDVSALLSAMSVYNKIPPPYCTTILIELHEKGPHNHTVRVIFRNGSFPIDPSQPLYPLTVPGCIEDCPLGQFIRLTKDSVPDDWDRECGIQKPSAPFSSSALFVIFSMGVLLILLLLSTGLMLWLRCQKEKSGVRYSRVPEDSMIN